MFLKFYIYNYVIFRQQNDKSCNCFKDNFDVLIGFLSNKGKCLIMLDFKN